MSTLPLQVDVEELLIQQVLRPNVQLTNLLGGEMRIYTRPPYGATPAEAPKYPLVTLRRITGSQGISNVLWQDKALVQIDCWAETEHAATTVARTAERALYDAAGKTYGLGRLSKVEEEGGLQPQRDKDSPLWHVLFSVRCYVHPPS